MRKRILTATLAFTLPSLNCWADSHCKSDEVVYFSCKIANSQKTVSLCGGSLTDPETFWLQYRFGKPGKLELVHPSNKDKSYKMFQGESRFGLGVRFDSVSFENKGVTYTIESSYSSLTGNAFEGVRVSQKGSKNVVSLYCGTSGITDSFPELAEYLDPAPR